MQCAKFAHCHPVPIIACGKRVARLAQDFEGAKGNRTQGQTGLGASRGLNHGTIVAVLGALIYFVSPIDLIPDNIPGAGYIDDGVVITVCLKMVDSDLQEYRIWREQNGKVLDIPDFKADIPLKKKIHRKGKKVD